MPDLDSLVSSLVDGEVTKITPIIGRGTVNKVYAVETPSGKVIVRLNNEDPASRFEKEKWCMGKASEIGIHVPQLLSVGEKDGYGFTIMEFIDGVPGDEADFIQRPLIWRELGRYARKIHSIPVAGLGLEFADMTEGDSEKHWQDYINYNIESLTPEDKLIELGVLNLESSKKVKELFEKFKTKKFTFGLNHGDLSLKNTILGKDGNVYLIDWGCAEADIVPHFDIGEIKRSSELTEEDWDSFLVGYSMTKEEFSSLEEDIKTRLLLCRFDKLRWALDKKPELVNEYAKEAKKMYEIKFTAASS